MRRRGARVVVGLVYTGLLIGGLYSTRNVNSETGQPVHPAPRVQSTTGSAACESYPTSDACKGGYNGR